MSSQPYWVLADVVHYRKPRRALLQMLELAKQLLTLGRIDEARALAASLLRGFVTLAGQNRLESYRNLSQFLRFVEVFAAVAGGQDNALVRLYGRVLHLRQATSVDWPADGLEHLVLRSCVLHGVSGGQASALADLQRKCKSWRLNSRDGDYPVTQQSAGTDDTQSDTDDEAGSDTESGSSDTDDESSSSESSSSITCKPIRRRGVTAEMVEQRRSSIVAQWLLKLSAVR